MRRSRNQIVLVLELVLVLDSPEGSCLPVPPGVASNAPPRRIPRSKPISRSKIEDEDEIEDEDNDYREASCMKSVANQIKNGR